MRSFYFFILLILIFHTAAFSQGCLPEGIQFYAQSQIDSFSYNYPGCTVIEGNVKIIEMDSEISNLAGLNTLEQIEGNLRIEYCENLPNLMGLESLKSIGGELYIEYNIGLENLIGLDHLQSVGGDLTIQLHEQLTSLQGLFSLSTVGKSLFVSFNPALISFTGLESLVSISENLDIQNNDALVSMENLESLNLVGNHIIIYNNDTLQNLDGLDQVTSIGGNLTIHGNYYLNDLTGLSGMTAIGNILKVESNHELTSLEGLNNIDASTMQELHISFNSSLSDCVVKSVCDFFASPNGPYSLFGNAAGCQNMELLLEHCQQSTDENVFNQAYLIYPNPANKLVNYAILDGSREVIVTLYNEFGPILSSDNPSNQFDISTFSPGLYFLKIKTEKWVVTKKLIIQ